MLIFDIIKRNLINFKQNLLSKNNYNKNTLVITCQENVYNILEINISLTNLESITTWE